MNASATLLVHLDEFPLDEVQRKYLVHSELKLSRPDT